MTNPKAHRLEQIAEELFDTANSLAGDETGHCAVALHNARNTIARVAKELDEGARNKAITPLIEGERDPLVRRETYRIFDALNQGKQE